MLKVYVEDGNVINEKLGAYIASDEADTVDPEDLRELTANELQDSYDVMIAPLADIESWIKESNVLSKAVESNPNRRRSTRVRNLPKDKPRAPPSGQSEAAVPAVAATLSNGFLNCKEAWEAAAIKDKGTNSAGRQKLLGKYKGTFFHDGDCDEGRVIVDLEWSQRKWVVVTQLAPVTPGAGAIGDESLESYVINGELHKMIAASSLNTTAPSFS